MSISEQISDAKFLALHDRHVGALTTLMLAIAASSRRMFPLGTKSIDDPTKNMSDRESFTRFLGGRIREVLLGDADASQNHKSISVPFRNKEYDIAHILYKFYRCELIHDGELPDDVKFSPRSSAGFVFGNRDLEVSIVFGDKIVLDYGWIELLIRAVVDAPCNGAEFGLRHFDLILIDRNDDPTFLREVAERHGTSKGRADIFKRVVRELTPAVILQEPDDVVEKLFWQLVESGEVGPGAITGLSFHELTNRAGHLQPRGLQMLRDIASGYELIEV